MLRKILISLFAFLIGLNSFCTPVKAEGPEDSVADQGCNNHDDTHYDSLHSGSPLAGQTFVPTKNRLDKIGLWLGRSFGTFSGKLKLTVRRHSDNAYIGGLILNLDSLSGKQGVSFDFSEDLVVVPGTKYRFDLFNYSASDNPVYLYTNIGGCLSPGNATVNNIEFDPDFDRAYLTFGYTVTTPSPSSPTETPSSDRTSGSASSGAVQPQDGAVESSGEIAEQPGVSEGNMARPANETDSSINPPKNLQAYDVPNDSGTAIKLDWEASESQDISGYRIFRSEKEKDDFQSIAMTEKNNLSFIDQGLTKNKNYYYFIRAYKDDKESVSSETVKIKPLDNKISQNQQATKNISVNMIIFYLSSTLLLSFLLFLLIKFRKKLSKKRNK